jgi:hypothetical protein
VLLVFYCLYTAALVREAQGGTAGLAWVTRAAWVLGPLAVAAYLATLVRQLRRPSF